MNPESYPIANATLLGNKLSQYTVVLPENYNVNEKFMLNDILDQIGLQTGYRLKFIKDSSSAVTEYEIVLGKTTRAGSATLYGALADESYAIKSIDNRIYVAYDNYLVATDAAAKLIALLSEAPTSVDVTETPDYAKELVKKKAGADIRVMTTNIVAAGDTESQKYLGEKYGITWEERVEIQAQMILTFLPDFVGMQEMQEGTTNGVRAQMHGVMNSHYVPQHGMAAGGKGLYSRFW